MNPKSDAIEIMKKYGSFYPGSPSEDFTVRKLKDIKGWVIFYDNPDILNFILPNELDLVDEIDENIVAIGLTGRNKRRLDAESVKIIYVEDNRK